MKNDCDCPAAIMGTCDGTCSMCGSPSRYCYSPGYMLSNGDVPLIRLCKKCDTKIRKEKVVIETNRGYSFVYNKHEKTVICLIDSKLKTYDLL